MLDMALQNRALRGELKHSYALISQEWAGAGRSLCPAEVKSPLENVILKLRISWFKQISFFWQNLPGKKVKEYITLWNAPLYTVGHHVLLEQKVTLPNIEYWYWILSIFTTSFIYFWLFSSIYTNKKDMPIRCWCILIFLWNEFCDGNGKENLYHCLESIKTQSFPYVVHFKVLNCENID